MGRCAAKDLQLPIWICSRLAGFCRAKRFANPLGDCHPLSPGDRPDLLHFGVVENDLKPLTHDDEYNECVTTSMPPPLAWPTAAGFCCTSAQPCHGAAMHVNLDPRDARPLYLQIMDEVRRAIVVGTLHAEDPLPSVRELAAELVLNPRTVSQAYQELEREGVIYVKRGQGTFVSANVRRGGAGRRRKLAVAVAKRALLEARRNGLGVEELVTEIQKLAAKEGDHQ